MEIHIPASVESIAGYSFQNCRMLKRVTGGEGLKSIGRSAFANCAKLSEITFHEGLREIGYEAFNNCTSITKIVLPEEMDEIGDYAFGECAELTEIVMPLRMKTVGSSVIESSGITVLTVPEGIEYLNSMAEGMRQLTTIYLPSTIKKISESEFSFCYKLTDIYFDGTTERWINLVGDGQTWMSFTKEWTVHCTDGDTRWKYNPYTYTMEQQP